MTTAGTTEAEVRAERLTTQTDPARALQAPATPRRHQA